VHNNEQIDSIQGYPETVDRMLLSTDAKVVLAVSGHGAAHLWQAGTGEPIAAFVLLPNSEYLFVSPEGHYSATSDVEKDLAYVVQTDEGQFTLTPAEFADEYGWKNDPEKVRLNLGTPAEPDRT
jgi:hypothetical protein